MARILFGLVIILSVSLAAIGTSRSFLIDSESSNTNSFSAGTLDLVDGASTLVPFSFSSLRPGDTVSKIISLRNAGTIPIGHLAVSATNKTGDSDLIDQLTVTPAIDRSNILGSDTIPPGETYPVVLNFSVPGILGEEWQGKTINFDLEFYAEGR